MMKSSSPFEVGMEQTEGKTLNSSKVRAYHEPKALTRDEVKTKLISKIKKQQKGNRKFNTTLSKQKLRAFISEKISQNLNNDFTCPVCLDMIMNPSPTPCGHIFCFKCLEEALIHKPVCPSCRTQIRTNDFPISRNYEKINSLFWKLSAEKPQFLKKLKQNKSWKNTRFIQPQQLQINQNIDVRDTQHIWCKANVKEIYTQNGKVNEVLIHYKCWNSIYDEVINIKSQRLAPESFFSSREDIPHYRLRQEDNNVRGRIRYNSEQENPFQYFFSNFEMMQEQPNFVLPLSFNRLTSLRISYERTLQEIYRNHNVNQEDSQSSEEREEQPNEPSNQSSREEISFLFSPEQVSGVLQNSNERIRNDEPVYIAVENDQNEENHLPEPQHESEQKLDEMKQEGQ